MKVPVTVTVNGTEQQAEVEPRQLLVQFLRDNLGLTGAHIGCETSQCGACTVLLDGAVVKSCTTLTVVLRTALGVVSGVGQAGGLLALTEGIFLDTGSGAPPATKQGARAERDVGFGHTWTALPVALPDGGGIEIVGSF